MRAGSRPMTAAMPPPLHLPHQRAAPLDQPQAGREVEHAGREQRVVFAEAVPGHEGRRRRAAIHAARDTSSR